METFREALITEPGKIILHEVEKKTPGSGEVMIKVVSSAICGSDMHLYSGRHPYAKLPTTVGHELAGVIDWRGCD